MILFIQLQIFDANRDGKLQLSEMARLVETLTASFFKHHSLKISVIVVIISNCVVANFND